MSEPIKVGDLVVVVRPSICPEAKRHHLGHVFTVARLGEAAMLTPYPWCIHCGRAHDVIGLFAWDDLLGGAFSLLRLKRIPPLSELEGEKREEELHA